RGLSSTHSNLEYFPMRVCCFSILLVRNNPPAHKNCLPGTNFMLPMNKPNSNSSKLVQVLVQADGLLVQALADAGGVDDLADLGGGVERVALHDLPVVEHALREGLTTSVLAEIGGESYFWKREEKEGEKAMCEHNKKVGIEKRIITMQAMNVPK